MDKQADAALKRAIGMLEAILVRQTGIHREMLAVAEDKRLAILKGDLELLEKSVSEEKKIVARIEEEEKKRLAVMPLVKNGLDAPAETDKLADVIRRLGLRGTISPEALIGASFQMSFSAVIALVAFYEAWAGKIANLFKNHNNRGNWHASASSPLAAGMDYLWRGAVWFLFAGFYRLGKSVAGCQSISLEARSSRLVSKTSQSLPLHGL